MKQKTRKKSTRIKLDNESVTPDSDVIELWCLRILVLHGGHRKFVTKDAFSSDELVSTLALEKYDKSKIDRQTVLKALRKNMHWQKKRCTASLLIFRKTFIL